MSNDEINYEINKTLEHLCDKELQKLLTFIKKILFRLLVVNLAAHPVS
jgi:hypothetical protein